MAEERERAVVRATDTTCSEKQTDTCGILMVNSIELNLFDSLKELSKKTGERRLRTQVRATQL